MEKHALIIETHNPYTADVYEYLLNRYSDYYDIEERTRRFISHDGEKDYRVYVRFKTMVTKEQEKAIREGIRREKLPTFRLYEDGYIQSMVRSGFKGVPFSSEVKEVKDAHNGKENN